jgi:hypothetical protein
MNEASRTISYRERDYIGAAFIGWFRWCGTNATFPLGRLHLTPRAVTVSIGIGAWAWESVTLGREEVRKVTVERRMWCRYVRLAHGKRGVPEYVLFRGIGFEDLLAELRAMGYPVE